MSDFESFVTDYYARFIRALDSFDKRSLEPVLGIFDRVKEQNGTVWVAGNGGSSAISNHTVCDLTKGTQVAELPTLKCMSLSANMPILTAIANDIAYDEVFSKQLEFYLNDRDAVLLVSSSGNSPNVVQACEYANRRGVPTVAFVGFGGGRLKEIASHVVWIPVENYGIVEDAHQSLIHVLSQFMRQRAADPE